MEAGRERPGGLDCGVRPVEAAPTHAVRAGMRVWLVLICLGVAIGTAHAQGVGDAARDTPRMVHPPSDMQAGAETAPPAPRRPPPPPEPPAPVAAPAADEGPRRVDFLSAEAQKAMRDMIARQILRKFAESQDQIRAKLQELQAQYPNGLPDEVDLRLDLGVFELGFDPLANDKISLKEFTGKFPPIKLKLPNSDVGIELNPEISIGLTGNWDDPDWDGRIKLGFAKEGKVELKYGVEIDTNKTLDDYYDGEWMKESEWRVLRFVEHLIAPTDFYGGGAVGFEAPVTPGSDTSINVGVEASWNIRERFTNLLFHEMHRALDELAAQQANQAEWRRARIEAEARRLGLNPEGMNNRELIAAIQSVWKAHPELFRPVFDPGRRFVGSQHRQSDWYCTNRPIIEAPVTLPPIIEMPPIQPQPAPATPEKKTPQVVATR